MLSSVAERSGARGGAVTHYVYDTNKYNAAGLQRGAKLGPRAPKQWPVYINIGVLHNKTRLTEPHDHISNQI